MQEQYRSLYLLCQKRVKSRSSCWLSIGGCGVRVVPHPNGAGGGRLRCPINQAHVVVVAALDLVSCRLFEGPAIAYHYIHQRTNEHSNSPCQRTYDSNKKQPGRAYHTVVGFFFLRHSSFVKRKSIWSVLMTWKGATSLSVNHISYEIL